MMPKSTATSWPSSSTNRLPGCMSAWKKPSRSAWRRKLWITVRAEPGRSKPLAVSASWSASGVPSIHSSVSTSRAVRSQSTAGMRKSASSLVFSAISEAAAASSRKSISIAHRARQRLHHLDQAQPLRFRENASALRATKKKAARSAAEAPLDAAAAAPSPRPLCVRRPPRSRRGAPARSRRRRPPGRSWRRLRSAACRAPRRWPLPLRPAGTAALVLQAFEIARDVWPTTSGRVARNWPSLT